MAIKLHNLCSLDLYSHGHHSTVTRIRFKPIPQGGNDAIIVASSSTDHTVKIYEVCYSQ